MEDQKEVDRSAAKIARLMEMGQGARREITRSTMRLTRLSRLAIARRKALDSEGKYSPKVFDLRRRYVGVMDRIRSQWKRVDEARLILVGSDMEIGWSVLGLDAPQFWRSSDRKTETFAEEGALL